MNLLKRELAPLTKKAWNEIDSRAKDIFKTQLTARKSVYLNGPHGIDFNAISEGKMGIIKGDNDEIRSSQYKVTPLIEARYTFELNKWEMDNLERGARDIDLKPLEEAVQKISDYEDNAVYNGLESAKIKGLIKQAKRSLAFGKDDSSIMNAVTEGMIMLQNSYADKPYNLIVGKEAYTRIQKEIKGYPLIKRIEEIIDGEVIFSNKIKGALLIPYNHEDIELTIGQDFAIGYQNHDSKNVKLFITESFMFRVIDPDIIIKYTL